MKPRAGRAHRRDDRSGDPGQAPLPRYMKPKAGRDTHADDLHHRRSSADPDTRASEKILRTCVHCGFCTATCPTYVLLGDELDSPRGRIYLMKQMLESGAVPTADTVKHVDRCLSCLSCMTTCPSGVHYMHLVDHGRAYIEENYRRPAARPAAALACCSACCPTRPGSAWRWSAPALARPFAGLHAGAAAARCWRWRRARSRPRRPSTGRRCSPPQGERRARVALLTGCAQQVHRTADQRGDDPPADPARRRGGGARGRWAAAAPSPTTWATSTTRHAFAKANIDAWTRELDARRAGRGRHQRVRLRHDGQGLRLHAPRGPGLRREGGADLGAGQGHHRVPDRPSACRRPRRTPTWSSPTTPPARCSTARRSRTLPKQLLAQAGFTVKRRAGRPSLLRLGRHLQPAAARDRAAAARPQGRQHRAHRART